MIQRVQSVYLVLAILLVAAVFPLDFVFDSRAATAYAWFTGGFFLLAGLAVVLCVLALAQFKARERQLKTVGYAILAVLALVVYLGVTFSASGDILTIGRAERLDGVATLALPAFASVFTFLARRGVRRDIALVRSMDRLR